MFNKQFMRLFLLVLMVFVTANLLAENSFAVSPQLINYQGELTDAADNPVPDGNYSLVFTIYDAATAGNVIWTETQTSVLVSDGFFSILLGSVVGLTDVIFNDSTRYLGITVGADPEISPRIRLVTMPYAFRTATVDGASGGTISGDVDISGKAKIGPANSNTGLNTFVAGSNDTASGDYSAVSGGDRNIASGRWATVGGGVECEATHDEATVGGGGWNIAGNYDATVSGGDSNEALGSGSTVAGGGTNIAEGAFSVVSGGEYNTVSAPYSTISGSKNNTIQTTAGYSFLFGIGSNLTEDSTFMVDMPHIRFGDETSGYEFPASDGTTGQTMSTDGLGQLSWSDAAAGDITGVTAGSGLTGGGASGSVILSVTTGGITSTHIASNTITQADIATGGVASAEIADESITTADIQNGSIYNADIANGTITDIDISNSAAIAPSKIAGTGVNLSDAQTITGTKSFDGQTNFNYTTVFNHIARFYSTADFKSTSFFGDSTMRVNNNGIRIGDPVYPSSDELIHTERSYNTDVAKTGHYIGLYNAGTAGVTGMYISTSTKEITGSGATGIRIWTHSDYTSRYGINVFCYAKSNPWFVGISYGIKVRAKRGEYAYGVWAYASEASYNYGGYFTEAKSSGDDNSFAGYFVGDVEATGFSSTGSGGIKIDHPLDPTNKYLYHSNIESPDMMNVYNGNTVLDANGEATVMLPDYFDALNKDFRYQLTCIGGFAPVYIDQEISGNSFSIAGGESEMKVSWQVTGIRKDAFAETNRISAVVDKPGREVGLYLHPEARGLGFDQSIHYEAHRQAELDDAEREAQEASERQ